MQTSNLTLMLYNIRIMAIPHTRLSVCCNLEHFIALTVEVEISIQSQT